MKGLAPHTQQIFEAVSKLDCIKPYLLVGGTALSLQIGTRQSEGLDFMKWRTSQAEKIEVAWCQIEKELAAVGEIQHKDILNIGHVEYGSWSEILLLCLSQVFKLLALSLALSYSGHRLKSKNLLAMLTNGNRFTRDARFEQLALVYAVTAQEIEDNIKSCLR